MNASTTKPTGHASLADALADHASRRATGDLLRLRVWPEWVEDGRQAYAGECPCCRSTLITFREVEQLGGAV